MNLGDAQKTRRSLNQFARDLKIPSSIDDALEIIATGIIHHVDVREVNGETRTLPTLHAYFSASSWVNAKWKAGSF
jgi:diacylglycerol kinase family enzyme